MYFFENIYNSITLDLLQTDVLLSIQYAKLDKNVKNLESIIRYVVYNFFLCILSLLHKHILLHRHTIRHLFLKFCDIQFVNKDLKICITMLLQNLFFCHLYL